MEHFTSQVRTDRGFGNDIYLASQQIFQVLLDGYDIEQGPFRGHFDQEIQIAGLGGLTPGHRAKQAHITGTMLRSDFEDLLAFLLKEFGNIHIGFFLLGRHGPPLFCWWIGELKQF
jgi:hypothetical protein